MLQRVFRLWLIWSKLKGQSLNRFGKDFIKAQ
jgi:hypothetical protein